MPRFPVFRSTKGITLPLLISLVLLCALRGPASASAALSASPARVVEGNEGSGMVAVPLFLSAPQAAPFAVRWRTAGGTATAGTDYTASEGTVVFEPGETIRSVLIEIKGDTQAEPEETILIELIPPPGSDPGDDLVTVRIQDNEPVTMVGFYEPTAFSEGLDSGAVGLMVQNPSAGRVAGIALEGETATPGTDVALLSAMVDLSQPSPTIPISILPDDLPEADETFLLSLKDPGPGVFLTPSGKNGELTEVPIPTGMALSGNMLVTADGTDLRIYRKTGTSWTPEAGFSAVDEGGVYNVAMDQEVIAADFLNTGVKLFIKAGDSWTLMATLPRGTPEPDTRRTLTLQDDTLAVGDPQPAGSAGQSGEVRIYERHHGGRNAWGQSAVLRPPATQPDFGSVVSLWGNHLAVSAPGNYSVLLFRRKPGDRQWDQILHEERYVEAFGRAVALNGDILAITQAGPLQTLRRQDPEGWVWTGAPPPRALPITSDVHPTLAWGGSILCHGTGQSVSFSTMAPDGNLVSISGPGAFTPASAPARIIAFDGVSLAVAGPGGAGIPSVDIYGPEYVRETIVDDETLFVTLDSTSVPGGGSTRVLARLSRPVPLWVTVMISTVPGSALPGEDYMERAVSITIQPGATGEYFPYITTYPLGPDESAEYFFLRIDASPFGIAGPDARVDILPSLPGIRLRQSSFSVPEGDVSPKLVTIFADISPPAGAGTSFTWARSTVSSASPATAGTDFLAAGGTVPVPEGATSASFDVTILPDTIGENDEVFGVHLAEAQGLLPAPSFSQALIYIINDDTGLPEADTYTMQEGGTLAGSSVTENDTGILEVALSQPPVIGNLALKPDGAFTYRPPVNFSGQVSFTYSDKYSVPTAPPLKTAAVIIHVTDLQLPLQINPDSFTMQEKTTLVVVPAPANPFVKDLFSNDSLRTPEGTLFTPVLEMRVSQVSHGTVTGFAQHDGGFTFIPEPGFTGLAGFTYELRDADGWSNPAAVTIFVQDDLPFSSLIRIGPPGCGLFRAGTPSTSLKAGGYVDYPIALKAGQTISLRASLSGNTLDRLEVRRPSGEKLSGGIVAPNSLEMLPVPVDGIYTIIAGHNTQNIGFSMELVINGGIPPVPPVGIYNLDTAIAPAGLRAAVAGSSVHPQLSFSFSGKAGEAIQIYFQATASHTFRLLDPQGALLARSSPALNDPAASVVSMSLPATGVYRITPAGPIGSAYNLQLHRGLRTNNFNGPVVLGTGSRAAGHLSGRGLPLAPGIETGTTFAAFADYGSGGPNEEAVANLVKSWSPDFIVAAGDHNYSLDHLIGSTTWIQTVGQFYGNYILGRADLRYPEQNADLQRFFPVPGNHDSGPNSQNGGEISSYLDYFHSNPSGTPRLPGGVHLPRLSYYKAAWGNADFFFLDSDNASVNAASLSTERLWLKEQISASTARWKFGVWHHPPFSSSSVHGSHPFMQWGSDFNGLTAIITGHDHIYERLDSGNMVTQFVVGLGGNSFYNFGSTPAPGSLVRYNSNHGALRVNYGISGVRFDFVSVGGTSGTVVDSLLIGTPPEITLPSGAETWTLTVRPGESLLISTRTPPAPGLLRNDVDPALLILDQEGNPVAADAAGAADGKNAAILLTVPASAAPPGGTARWTVRVLNESGAIGEYELDIRPSGPGLYDQWSSAAGLDDGPAADPDRDGVPNIMEYLLDSNPLLPSSPGQPGLSLNAGESGRIDVNLPPIWNRPVSAALQRSTSLESGSWLTMALKSSGQSDWSGPEAGLLQIQPSGAASFTASTGPRHFYRLLLSLE